MLTAGKDTTMVLRTTGSVLVVFLWSVTVVLGQGDWGVTYSTQSICALNGSTVELSCTYKYPSGHKVTSTFWFTRKDADGNLVNLSDDPDYRGRVTYRSDEKNSHTLIITDLRETDSAQFKFRFITDQPEGKWIGTSGVTLSVTVLQVEMTPATVTEGQNVTLTCITSCPLTDNPTYIWYKNRQRLNNRNTSSNIQILKLVSSEDRGRYSCAVEGHEDFSSPEHTVNVQYGPKNTAVSVSPSGEIMEGSSLTLFCTSDANPPVDKYTWYKKTVTSPKASGQRYSITNIRSEDSGEYYCEAENGRGSMNSTALMITVAGEKILFITASVGITVVVLLIILCLSGFIWFRKRSSKSTSETKDKADDGLKDSMYVNLSSRIMRSSTAQTKTTDTVDDGHGDSNPIYNNL